MNYYEAAINKLIKYLLFLYLILIQFENISMLAFQVGRYPLWFYLQYFILIICIILICIDLFHQKGEYFLYLINIIFFIGCSYVVSIIFGANIKSIISESLRFVLPLVIIALVKKLKIDSVEILKTLLLTSILGGVISFLIAVGYIPVDIWTAPNQLTRTAIFVDGTLGIAGIIVGINLLDSKKIKINKMMVYFGLVGAASIVFFGLSRSRFLIVAILLGFQLIINLLNNNSKFKGNFKLILYGTCLFSFVSVFFINEIKAVIATMNYRFIYDLSNSLSISIRKLEMQKHLELFMQSPFLGQGWGVRSKYFIGGNELFVHNIYTGLLMHGGILLGGAYFIYLLRFFIRNFRKILNRKANFGNEISFLFLTSILLLGIASAGITQSGALFMMAYIYSVYFEERKGKYNRIKTNLEATI